MPSLPRKRSRAEEREISPPPLRRKLHPEPDLNASSPQITRSESVGRGSQKAIKTRFEIISWNVNGISHLLPRSQKSIKAFFSSSSSRQNTERDTDDEDQVSDPANSLSLLRKFLKRHHFPQIICLQEVKISAKDEKTRKAVERAANEGEGPGYQLSFESPRDKFNATGWGGKVYGVCTLIRDDVTGLGKVKTRGVQWDLEGRVLVTEVEFGRQEVEAGEIKEKLVVINGYWPNGTTNPWRDSNTGIVKGTRHDMKRNFHSLMLSEVVRYQEAGWQAVLIGDMNIARSPLDGYPGIRLGAEHVRNRREWNEMFIWGEEGMKGVDSWRWIHGEKRGYSYHGETAEEWGRSCDRVDLGVVSRGLIGEGNGEPKKTQMRLAGADIWESIGERGGSDHVPISVVLDLGQIEVRPEMDRDRGLED
jgi:exonuclease III